ncbi:MAG: DNA repair protein RadC [Anaerolineales bacterium]|nr:DNA repair protein RadC [Anaerolineales bacterium]
MGQPRSNYRITDMMETERPRERLARLGAHLLKGEELLAILLRVGVSGENAVQVGQRLLHDFGGFSGLHRASFSDVCNQHGVGPAKAAQIKAALEIGHRMKQEERKEQKAINQPEDAADLVMHEMSVLEQEELRVILLDTRNRVMDIITVYKGSLNSSQVRVGELFKEAIRRNAAALIIIHNHPSGDPTPSPDDVTITRAIIQAGKLLDIEILDHIVIGAFKWVSLKQRQLAFS